MKKSRSSFQIASIGALLFAAAATALLAAVRSSSQHAAGRALAPRDPQPAPPVRALKDAPCRALDAAEARVRELTAELRAALSATAEAATASLARDRALNASRSAGSPVPAAAHPAQHAPHGPADGRDDEVALALLRKMTTQCGRTYVDELPGRPVLLRRVAPSECPDLEAAVRNAHRAPAPPLAFDMTKLPADAPNGALQLPACALRWFAPWEACDIVERSGNLIMIVWSKCACEGAWQNAQECHQPENMATGWPGDQRAICPSWRRSHFFYKDWYVDNRIEEGELEHLLNTSARNTIYAGTALAYKGAMLNFSHIRHRWFDRLFQAAAAHGRTRFLCATTLAVNDTLRAAAGVSPEVIAATGEASGARHNAHVRALCAEHGLEVFDGYALTKGCYTHDGTHYQSKENVVMAQVLLNYLARRDSRAPSSPHPRPLARFAVERAAQDARRAEAAQRQRATTGANLLKWQEAPHGWRYLSDSERGGALRQLPGVRLRGCECLVGASPNASGPACWCEALACAPHVTPAYLEAGIDDADSHATACCAPRNWDAPLPASVTSATEYQQQHCRSLAPLYCTVKCSPVDGAPAWSFQSFSPNTHPPAPGYRNPLGLDRVDLMMSAANAVAAQAGLTRDGRQGGLPVGYFNRDLFVFAEEAS